MAWTPEQKRANYHQSAAERVRRVRRSGEYSSYGPREFDALLNYFENYAVKALQKALDTDADPRLIGLLDTLARELRKREL